MGSMDRGGEPILYRGLRGHAVGACWRGSGTRAGDLWGATEPWGRLPSSGVGRSGHMSSPEKVGPWRGIANSLPCSNVERGSVGEVHASSSELGGSSAWPAVRGLVRRLKGKRLGRLNLGKKRGREVERRHLRSSDLSESGEVQGLVRAAFIGGWQRLIGLQWLNDGGNVRSLRGGRVRSRCGGIVLRVMAT